MCYTMPTAVTVEAAKGPGIGWAEGAPSGADDDRSAHGALRAIEEKMIVVIVVTIFSLPMW